MMKQYKQKYITLKTTLVVLLGSAVIGLVIYNAKDLIFGTPLTVSTTTDGATLSSPFLPIEGVAKHARSLLINGRPVALDRLGNFRDGVLLSTGYNIVEVELRNQFGSRTVKTYQVVVESPTESVADSGAPAIQNNL